MLRAQRLVSAFLLSTAFLAVGPVILQAQQLRLIKENDAADAGTNFKAIGARGGIAYFSAYRPGFGTELWQSDGTRNGTTLFVDIWPGPESSDPVPVRQVGETMYFVATDAGAGRELWKSDGSVEGTVRVKDISPGPASTWTSVYSEHRAVVTEGRLFFEVHDSFSSNGSLWVSDGSESGTHRIGASVNGFKAVAGGVFFGSPNEDDGCQLWVSDGSETGTHRVESVGAAEYCPWLLADFDGRLLFAPWDPDRGYEPWLSDGTDSGTYLLKDISPGAGGSDPAFCGGSGFVEPVQLGERLFFSARDDKHGCELWVTDGTPEGTALFLDAAPPIHSESLGPFVSLGDRFLFHSYGRLLVTDGTEDGTRWLTEDGDWVPATFASSAASTRSAADFWDRLVVSGLAGDGSGRRAFFHELVYSDKWGADYDLWITDGTPDGTVRLSRVAPPTSGDRAWPWPEVNGRFVFVGEETPLFSGEPWTAEAGGGGILPLYDIMPGSQSSDAKFLAHLGDRILFSADDGVHGRELWVTDGSYEGTALLLDVNNGSTGGWPEELAAVNGSVFFASGSNRFEYDDHPSDGAGRELWRTDGTDAGTYLVSDILPGSGSSNPFQLTAAGGRLFFQAAASRYDGPSLWASDGTRAGTRLTEFSGDSVRHLFGTDKYLFVALENDDTCELWRSDGSDQGAVLLSSHEDDRYAACGPVGQLGGVVLFYAEDRFWRTDGRPEGTFKLPVDVEARRGVAAESLFYFSNSKGLWVTDGSLSGPTRLFRHYREDLTRSGQGDGLFFIGNDGVNGNSLVYTDGTKNGTRLLKEFRPAGDSVYIAEIVGAVDGTAFFTVTSNKEESGHEAWLWKSDGTSESTVPVAPLPFRHGTSWRQVLRGILYFTADEPTTGRELWQTDGTRRGTRMVADLNPGWADSRPSYLTAVGDTLFFAASTGRGGRELWALEAGGNPAARLPKLLSLPAADGLGSDEVAVLGSKLSVLDAGSGAVLSEGSFAPSDEWEAVDFESLGDLNANDSSDIAVLARNRARTSIYMIDGLSGEPLTSARVGRRGYPVEMESLGNGSAVVLSRNGVGGSARISVVRLVGGESNSPLELELPEEFDAKQLEVVGLSENRRGLGGAIVVVLGRELGGGPRLLSYDIETGGLLGDWELDEKLVPVDLESLDSPVDSPRVVVLVTRPSTGASTIVTLDPTTGEVIAKRRIKKKYRVLDLEPMSGQRDAKGPNVGVLWTRKGRRQRVGISTLNALTGKRLHTIALEGLQRTGDLAFVRMARRGEDRVAVLGEAVCGERRDRLDRAVTLWDLEDGQRLGCYPVE